MADIIDIFLPVTGLSIAYALLMFIGFFCFMFIVARFLPGIKGTGEPLKDGSRKEYKLSGLLSFLLTTIITLIVFIVKLIDFPNLSFSIIAQHFWSLLIVANVFALIWSILIFIFGRIKTKTKRKGFKGFLLDFWFGPELNPTLWGVDLKMFFYQPSLIGLSLINWSFAFLQYENLGRILPQMWMYQAFW